jgi:hypothetical protein
MNKKKKVSKFGSRHYAVIAEVLRKNWIYDTDKDLEVKNYIPYSTLDQWYKIRDELIKAFKKDNPRFSENMFLAEAQPERG